MIKLIGGDDLLQRGVTNMAMLRPVLAGNASSEEMLAGNATLRKDEWERVDERVNAVMRERLTIADDLRSRGLVQPVSLGTILRVTERIEDFDSAELSFDGDTSPQRDRPSYLRDVRPIPVISKDFSISWRQLDASRQRGEPLDTTAAELAARKVRDKIQSLITLGHGAGPDGNSIPGLTNATNRLTVTLSASWTTSGTPIADVENCLETAYNNNLFGPFVLYVPKNWWAAIQGDYETSGGAVINRTIMERILAFTDIESIKPLDSLPDDEAVLVQMTRDVLDLSEAQAITTVQWQKNPFVTNFRVLAVVGPHIKSIETDAGDTINGIVHLS